MDFYIQLLPAVIMTILLTRDAMQVYDHANSAADLEIGKIGSIF